MSESLKVTIIVGGRFHAFDLAEQLQKNGILYQLVTTYPKSKIERFNIPKEKLLTFSFIEYFKRGVHKIFRVYPLNYFLSEIFDRFASKKVKKDADVYIIWASMGLHTIKKLKKINPKAKIILERGSVHISEQDALLKKISSKNLITKKTINKELKEYKIADFIAVPSKFAKNSFSKYNINKKKLFVNPYGVDLKMFCSKNIVRDNSVFVVGYAGTLSARKNIKGLVEAVKLLKNDNINNIRLNLVGNIEEKTFSKKLLHEDFIRYMPAVAQKDLLFFFNDLDVFVLNSIEDGFGMVVTQALACGIPVITTKNSGGADIIEDGYNGFVISPFSNTELAEKIKLLMNLSPNEIDKIKENAVISVKKGYTWDDYGNRYVTFLKQIIK